jgi:ribosomal protein S18 acetylase RimI-like enzyme
MDAELVCTPARDEQIDEFLELLRLDAENYLIPTMEVMGWSWAEFARRVRGVGRVFCVYQGEQKVGCYWIEERGRIVHLHGIVVARAFQGQGIGSRIIRRLAEEYRGRMDAIELGVHQSNQRARALYERLGFVAVRFLPEVGFTIMQLPLKTERASDPLPGTA